MENIVFPFIEAKRFHFFCVFILLFFPGSFHPLFLILTISTSDRNCSLSPPISTDAALTPAYIAVKKGTAPATVEANKEYLFAAWKSGTPEAVDDAMEKFRSDLLKEVKAAQPANTDAQEKREWPQKAATWLDRNRARTRAVGVGLMYVIDKFFKFVEEKLTDDTKLEIAVWLLGVKTADHVPWPETFASVFDRVFGKKHLSWKCVRRSFLASAIITAALVLLDVSFTAKEPEATSFLMRSTINWLQCRVEQARARSIARLVPRLQRCTAVEESSNVISPSVGLETARRSILFGMLAQELHSAVGHDPGRKPVRLHVASSTKSFARCGQAQQPPPTGEPGTENGWHADHIYRHDPNAIECFLLIAFLALNIFHAFFVLNLKPEIREGRTHTGRSKMAGGSGTWTSGTMLDG
jgi:hypothetical protein